MAFKMKGSPMNRNFGIGDPDKKAERQERRTRIRAKNKRRRQEYIESGDRKRDLKALPQQLLSTYRKMPGALLEDVAKAGTSAKEFVQKGVKKAVEKVKNREKRNK